MKTDLAARISRLEANITLADALLPLESEHVQAWFRRREAQLCRAMIDAHPTDDDGRRAAALQAWALQDLQLYIRNSIDVGRRTPKELEKLRSQDAD